MPSRGGLDEAIPKDPLIYRFYEVVHVYGPTIKALVHEMFGDGIVSAIDFEMSQKPTPTDVSAEPHEEKPSFDFDLSGLDAGTPKAAEPAPASGASSSGMSLDLADLSLDSPGGGGGGSAEAVGTKLELAKAYLEIGDKDGARDILQEVAKEGSAAQQEEAKKLIASL